MINNTALINLINDSTDIEKIAILKKMIDVVVDNSCLDESDCTEDKETAELLKNLRAASDAIETIYGIE